MLGSLSGVVPKNGAELPLSQRNRVFINVNWDSASSGPHAEAGTIKDKGDKLLAQLCEDTGGEVFFTGDMLELEKAFTKISAELRSQYLITYKPANQNYDGRARRLTLY